MQITFLMFLILMLIVMKLLITAIGNHVIVIAV